MKNYRHCINFFVSGCCIPLSKNIKQNAIAANGFQIAGANSETNFECFDSIIRVVVRNGQTFALVRYVQSGVTRRFVSVRKTDVFDKKVCSEIRYKKVGL